MLYCSTELWHVRLHDAVMCVHCFRDNDTFRVFAGLADGTLAVLEDVQIGQPDQDIIYIPIGQSPIICMTEVDSQLWCASGNIVYIIHARFAMLKQPHILQFHTLKVNYM